MAEESRAPTSGLLEQLIAGAKAELQNNVLVEVPALHEQQSADQPPFLELPEAGPWPDFFIYHFTCQRCGQPFTLGAETYHGSGGRWGLSKT